MYKPHVIEPVTEYDFSQLYASSTDRNGIRKRLYVEVIIGTNNKILFRVDYGNESRWTSDFDEAVNWYNEIG